MSKKAVERAARLCQQNVKDVDGAFEDLVEELSENKSGMWNSAELYDMYQSHGHKVTRRQLIQQVSDYFGNDLVLSSPGISSIIMFQAKASTVLTVCTDHEDDDMNFELNKIKKRIVQEVKALPLPDKTKYNITFDREAATESVSDTILELFAKLSKRLDTFFTSSAIPSQML